MTFPVIAVILTLIAVSEMSIVNRGPPKLLDSYPRHYAASVGDAVRLVCPISSDEPAQSGSAPLFDWTKDGRLINAGWARHRLGVGTLRIRDLELDDAGDYRCQATNGFGTVRATLRLQVTDVPGQTNQTEQSTPEATANGNELVVDVGGITSWPEHAPAFDVEQPVRCTVRVRNVTVKLGDLALLNCELLCNGRPEVEWFKQPAVSTSGQNSPAIRLASGGPLVTSVHQEWLTEAAGQSMSSSWRRRGKQQNNLAGKFAYISRLTIDEVNRNDSGLYACVNIDKNGRRNNFASAFLNVADNTNVNWTFDSDIGHAGVIPDSGRSHHVDLVSSSKKLTPTSLSTTVAISSTVLVVFVVVVACFAKRRACLIRSSPRRSMLVAREKVTNRRRLANAFGDRSSLVLDVKSTPPFVVGYSTSVTPPPTPSPSLLLLRSTDILSHHTQWSCRAPRGGRWLDSMHVANGIRQPIEASRLEPVSTPLLLSWYLQDGAGVVNGQFKTSPASVTSIHYDA